VDICTECLDAETKEHINELLSEMADIPDEPSEGELSDFLGGSDEEMDVS